MTTGKIRFFLYALKRAFLQQSLYDPCWSCEHTPLIHNERGCFFSVVVTDGPDHFCPCSLSRASLTEKVCTGRTKP